MHDLSNDEERHSLFPFWFWLLVLTILAIWGAAPILIPKLASFYSLDERKAYEDVYGSINTLFSGLAFLGVILSLFIQGREFRNQLKEMQSTAREMTAQSEIYRLQLESTERQNRISESRLNHFIRQDKLLAQPFLVVSVKANNERLFELTIRNYGAIVYNFHFRPITAPGSPESLHKYTHFLAPEGKELKKDLEFTSPYKQEVLEFVAEYTTRAGDKLSETFHIPPLRYGEEYQLGSNRSRTAASIDESNSI